MRTKDLITGLVVHRRYLAMLLARRTKRSAGLGGAMVNPHVARRVSDLLPKSVIMLMLALATLVVGCNGWIPGMELPEGVLELENRSDERVEIFLERPGGRDPRRMAVIEPGEREGYWSLGEGGQGECIDRSIFTVRDEAGKELATIDAEEEAVCDGDPWVWEGED